MTENQNLKIVLLNIERKKISSNTKRANFTWLLFRNRAPWSYMTWLWYNLQLDDVRGDDFENFTLSANQERDGEFIAYKPLGILIATTVQPTLPAISKASPLTTFPNAPWPNSSRTWSLCFGNSQQCDSGALGSSSGAYSLSLSELTTVDLLLSAPVHFKKIESIRFLWLILFYRVVNTHSYNFVV